MTSCMTAGSFTIFNRTLYVSRIFNSPSSSIEFLSFLKMNTKVVVIKKTMPQNHRNFGSVTTPVLEGMDLKYSLQKSGEFNARKTTFPIKYPAVWPTVLHVDAYPRFGLDSIVNAQPSTAMSCVAARKFRAKNDAVNNETCGASELRYLPTFCKK